MRAPFVVHADESCLGNGKTGNDPGGAGALIECERDGTVERTDLYIHAPATTNNRMALSGAIATLALLGAGKKTTIRALFVSDSEYLVKGVNEWMPGWKRRGWRRSGGPILNLELWQALDRLLAGHDLTFRWVRGHSGHVKNEYADHLAVRAAELQQTSQAAEPSGFVGWLAERQEQSAFAHYDADADYRALVSEFEVAR